MFIPRAIADFVFACAHTESGALLWCCRPGLASSMADGSHGVVPLSQGCVSPSRARAFEAAGGNAHASTHHWSTVQSPGCPDVQVWGGGGLPVRQCVLLHTGALLQQ